MNITRFADVKYITLHSLEGFEIEQAWEIMNKNELAKVNDALGGFFTRVGDAAVIYPSLPGLNGELGKNINGPSIIKVPSWLANPLGRYYLYFAHHAGEFIRLAYAENIEGPYTVYSPGTLYTSQVTKKTKNFHLASPDVHANNETQELWMYFHAPFKGKGIYKDQKQMTFLARSRDGIHFIPGKVALAPFYLRVFHHDNYVYGIAKNDNKNGVFLRSPDGTTQFERGLEFIDGFRHCAVLEKGNRLWIFFSRVGDAPERILVTSIDLSTDWNSWTISPPIPVLEPEFPWEGNDLPIEPSAYGATGPANALRDPAIFVENNELYLFYCVKGEQGIACSKFISY